MSVSISFLPYLVGVGIFSAWRDIEIFKKISIDTIKETVF